MTDLDSGIYHYNKATNSYHLLTPLEAWNYNGTIMAGFHPPRFDVNGNETHPATFHGKPVTR